MAAENYPSIMDHIFRFEGGYVDHKADPGGATNMGITIGTLRAYRGGTTVTKDDVRGLSKAEAMEIYRRNYWNAICGDELPSGVDLCTMDSAVNSGPSRGAKWLQRAVGANPDGKVGSQTLARAEAADPKLTVERMCADRMSFLKGLGTWPTFGKGWSSRVEAVRSLALQLADNPEHVAPTPEAPVTETKPTSTGSTTSKASGGALGAGIPNVLLLLAVKLHLIPADVASDPETILLLTAVLTAAGGWIGAYLAPRNAPSA